MAATAFVGGTLTTLLDQAKTHGQFGELLPIVNSLSKATPLAAQAYWEQSNLPNGQLTVRVTGRPTGSIRRVNQAIAPSKSTHAQITEQLAEFADFAKIDPAALKGFASPMLERARIIKQHPEVLMELLEDTVINGSSGDGNGEFDGFLVRPEYSVGTSDQVLKAGGTGGGSVYASILLIYMGTDTCKIVYPRNSLAGVQHQDFGLSMTSADTGADGNELPMWKDWFSITAGLSIPDPTSVVRICNIVTNDVKGVTGTQEKTDYTTNIVYRMSEAMDRIAPRIKASGARPMWVMPRSVKSGFNIQVLAHTFSNVYQPAQLTGATQSPESMFGIPIVISDLMGYTEAEVS